MECREPGFGRLRALWPNDVWLRRGIAIWIVLTVAMAGKTLLQGDHHSVYKVFATASRNWWAGQSLYGPQEGIDIYRYSPTFSVAFTPFAVLPPRIGNLLWNTCSILLLFGSVRLLARHVFPGPWPPWREGLLLSYHRFTFGAHGMGGSKQYIADRPHRIGCGSDYSRAMVDGGVAACHSGLHKTVAIGSGHVVNGLLATAVDPALSGARRCARGSALPNAPVSDGRSPVSRLVCEFDRTTARPLGGFSRRVDDLGRSLSTGQSAWIPGTAAQPRRGWCWRGVYGSGNVLKRPGTC